MRVQIHTEMGTFEGGMCRPIVYTKVGSRHNSLYYNCCNLTILDGREIMWMEKVRYLDVIKTCEAGLVLSVTRILRATLARFRVYVCMYVCMYVIKLLPNH